MARLPTLSGIDAAPAGSRSRLESIKRTTGTIPNLFRVMGNSPAALEAYFGVAAAMSKGRLSAQTRERIALAISEFNGSDYDLSAHSFTGNRLAGLDAAEIRANRNGSSNDAEADAAVRFALAVAQTRGNVSDEQVDEVKQAGYDDAQVVEIIQHVALTSFTNYLSGVAKPDIDFPVVRAQPVLGSPARMVVPAARSASARRNGTANQSNRAGSGFRSQSRID